MTSVSHDQSTLLGRAWIIALLVALAGCNQQREALPEETAESRDAAAVSVTAAPVTFRAVQRYVGLVGTLYGYEEITLKAKVAGRVRKISRDMADRVKSGELLLDIDPTDYQLNVRQAQKSLLVELAKLGLTELPGPKADITHIPTVLQAQLKCDNARVRLERAEKLLARKAGTEEDLSDKTSEFRVAKAEYDNQVMVARAGIAAIQVKQEALAIAQQQLEDTRIKVPVPSQPVPDQHDGGMYAIVSRSVSEGSYVMPGDQLFKLVIEHPLKFRGRVPERRTGEVRLGQRAQIYASAYPEPFIGEVTRINPSVDPATRTFDVEILVPNKQGQLKPGAFAKTAILTELDQHAATVPLEAIVHVAGVTKIFLVVNGHAKEMPVRLGMQETEWVELSSPKLPEPAQVVTSGQTVIADGTALAVRAVASEPSAPVATETETKSQEPSPAPAESESAGVARREAGP
jgi:membrane fusion protein, multidrug efflux system